MNLKKVTLAGIDEKVDPWDLIVLLEEFPFAEFAILFDDKKQGKENIFPGLHSDWRTNLWKVTDFYTKERKKRFPLAAHICEYYSTRFSYDKYQDNEYEDIFGECVGHCLSFSRYLLNLDDIGCLSEYNLDKLLPEGQIILQHISKNYNDTFIPKDVAYFNDSKNKKSKTIISTVESRFAVSCDISNTTGFLPYRWAEADQRIFCGYSGGLDLVDLPESLGGIDKISQSCDIWLNFQNEVRENDWFSLEKSRRILEFLQPYIV